MVESFKANTLGGGGGGGGSDAKFHMRLLRPTEIERGL